MSRMVVPRPVLSGALVLASALGSFAPRAVAQQPTSPDVLCTGTYRVTVDGGTASWPQYTTGHTSTFTVTNESDPGCPAVFSLSYTEFGLSNVSLNKTNTVNLQPGASDYVTATYDVGAPGTASVTLYASGPAGSSGSGIYTITVTPPPSYAVSVTPDGGSQSATGGTTGNVATFTVTNQGNQGTLTYDLSIQGCTAPLTNCTTPTSVTVAQGASQNVTAHFDAQNVNGTGTITLRAIHTASGTYDNGSINVTVTQPPSYSVSVTPDGGTQSATGGTTGNVATFTVTNQGNQGTLTYDLSIQGCTTPLTNCTTPTSVTVAQGGSQNVTAHFDAQTTNGTGAITLRATHTASGTYDNGSINVTVTTSYAVSVTPDGGSQSATGGTTGNVATFTVTNQGNQGTLTYDLSIQGCTAPLTNCTTPASVTVTQGGSQNVTAHFDAQNVNGTGTITLRATHTASGTYDNGSINVTVTLAPLYTVAVTPDNGSQSALTGSSGNVATFTVTNQGNQGTLTYDLSIQGCTAPLTSCTTPASVTVTQGGSQNVTAHFDAQNTTGTGTITLRATHTPSGTYDNGSIDVTVTVAPLYTVAVGPDGGSQQATGGTAGNVATFTVTNQGNQGTLTYDLSIQGCTTPLTNCTTPTSVTVAQGASQPVTAQFDAQTTNGTGTITLRATHTASGTYDNGSINVTVSTSYTVAVTPDGGTQSSTGGTTGNVATFTVANQGNQGTLTYDLSIQGCTAPLTNCTSTAASVTVGQGGSQNVTAHFDAQTTSGTGTITLRATHTASGTYDNGSINVTVALVGGAPVIALVNHNRDNVDRSLCLTTPAGEEAAVECGDLVAYHAMPAFRSMGQDRTLTLVYNSATADPRPRVAMQATLAAGSPLDSVVADLKVSGVERSRAAFSPWAAGATKQVVLAFDAAALGTGAYPFTVSVTSYVSDTTYGASLSDTLIIVNRAASEFGAGWYLAGVERLFPGQPDGSILWVGGDGSAKIYRSMGGGQWQAPAGAFRDVIVQVGSTYERHAKHGVTVTFDGMGHQISVTNRLGHTTTFTWDGNGRLTQIHVPGPGGN